MEREADQVAGAVTEVDAEEEAEGRVGRGEEEDDAAIMEAHVLVVVAVSVVVAAGILPPAAHTRLCRREARLHVPAVAASPLVAASGEAAAEALHTRSVAAVKAQRACDVAPLPIVAAVDVAAACSQPSDRAVWRLAGLRLLRWLAA